MADEEAGLGLPGSGSGEEGEPESRFPDIDPTASAMALDAARENAGLAARAAAYFEKQARLVTIQTEHLHEQREVQLSNLKLKRLGERIRVTSQLAIAIFALLVLGYMFIMVHDAITSRAVIVDPFDAPPALEPRGLTGKVVASGVLDQLVRMQAATRSSAVKRELAESWSDNIKLEVPATGISLAEIDRFLKHRFGQDTHIGGDLVQAADGSLILTVRGDGVQPKTLTGRAGDLAKLTTEAGEYVYSQTQPALYAIYLHRMGRDADAVAFSQNAILSAPPEEQPYLLNTWAITNLPDAAQRLSLEQEALKLKPDYWDAYYNAAGDARLLGREEDARRILIQMQKQAGGRPGPAPEIDYLPLDDLTGNYLAERRALLEDAAAHSGIGNAAVPDNPIIAAIDVQLHDMDDLRIRLAGLDEKDPAIAAVAHWIRGRLAEGAGDYQTAVREWEAWDAANKDPAISAGDTSYSCEMAVAEQKSGHPDRADAALDHGGHFVDCYRWRADITDMRGDWPKAQRQYQEAVEVAPDLPAAYYSWGLALARHGDLTAAAEKLAASHARGPGWAEPLKAWGDLLMRQGKPDEALEKYDAALKLAPAWTDLQRSRDEAKKRA